jgi:hypothetical protein
MKKKSPRGIPDFSQKRPNVPGTPFQKNVGEKPARPPEPPKVKPPATSSKFGRRGG